MHIGINAQLLSFSQNYRNGGVSRYIRYLLNELAKQPGKHEYTVFVNGQEIVEKLSAQHAHITYVSATWSESQPAARVAGTTDTAIAHSTKTYRRLALSSQCITGIVTAVLCGGGYPA